MNHRPQGAMRRLVWGVLFAAAGTLLSVGRARAAEFDLVDGDVGGLRQALAAANTNGEDDTISLAAGGTYTLPDVDNNGPDGPNGLALIAPDGGHSISLVGENTTLRRDPNNSARFRLLEVLAGATLNLSGLTLSGGSAGGGGTSSNGGGVFNSGTLALTGCSVLNNTADATGGGIFNAGTLSLEGCTLAGNTSGSSGGALANAPADGQTATATLRNCTLSGNTALAAGGAIFTSILSDFGTAANVALESCTLAGNRRTDASSTGAGGVESAVGTSGTVNATYRNCIFAALTGGGPNLHSKGANSNAAPLLVSGGFNISSDGSGNLAATGDRPSTPPQLGTLQDNGGPTQTQAPQPGSSAIDAGNTALSTDQRGVMRPVDGNGDGAAQPDMGAVELDPVQSGPRFVVNSDDDHDDGVCNASDCTLREALNSANLDIGSNIIGFSPAFFTAPHTIVLAEELMILDNGSLLVGGPGAKLLTVSGGGATRVFEVATGADATLTGLTISGGAASGTAPANSGGGIFNGGTLSLGAVVVSNNAAVTGGGLFNAAGAVLRAASNTWSGNTATDGAALRNSGNATLANATFSGNTATGSGGGVFNDGTLSVANCTLASNGANSGGALFSSGTLTLGNSILANSTSGANLVKAGGTFTSNGFNLSSDAAALNGPNDRNNTPPRLGALANYGGPVPTLALLSGSPAFNAGSNALLPADTLDTNANGNTTEPLPFDARGPGFARVQEGTADIGAFEAVNTAVNLVGFKAQALSGGVWLWWKTGYEVNNLGFNVYRQVRVGGKWGALVKLNPQLVMGAQMQNNKNKAPSGGFVYAYGDKLPSPAPLYRDLRYWLEDVDSDGTLTKHGPVSPAQGRGAVGDATHPNSPTVR